MAALSTTLPAAAAMRAVLVMVCVLSAALFQSSRAQQCGPNIGSCSGSNCCSQFGYCGTSCSYCGAGCQSCCGVCGGCNCFPASAKVTTRGGITKPISELGIGEEVAVWNGNGEMEYDAVYAHGHADLYALSEFIVLTLSGLQNENATKTLQLTPRHFTIVQGLRNTLEYKVAEDVKLGDRMLVTTSPRDDRHVQFSTFAVSGIERQVMKGLYKPFTLKGNIVVNDVLASCHSEWFLHSTLKRMCGAHVLPSIYQAMLTPIRMLFNGMDKDAYKGLYNALDSHCNIARKSCATHGLKGYIVKLFNMGALPPRVYST